MRDAALILFRFSWRHVYLVLKNILLIPMLIQRLFVKLAGAHNLNGKVKDIWRADPRLEQLELSSLRNSLDSIQRTLLRLLLLEDRIVLGAGGQLRLISESSFWQKALFGMSSKCCGP